MAEIPPITETASKSTMVMTIGISQIPAIPIRTVLQLRCMKKRQSRKAIAARFSAMMNASTVASSGQRSPYAAATRGSVNRP